MRKEIRGFAANKNNHTWSEFKLKMVETFRPVNKNDKINDRHIENSDSREFSGIDYKN